MAKYEVKLAPSLHEWGKQEINLELIKAAAANGKLFYFFSKADKIMVVSTSKKDVEHYVYGISSNPDDLLLIEGLNSKNRPNIDAIFDGIKQHGKEVK